MNFITNYIKNGQGYGLKLLLWVSLVFVIGIGGYSYHTVKTFLRSPEMTKFINEIPVMQVMDGVLVRPRDAYVVLEYPGAADAFLVINTTQNEIDVMSFRNVLYMASAQMFIKTGNNLQSAIYTDDMLITPAVIHKAVNWTIILLPLVLVVFLFGLIWLGYVFLYLVSRVFSWIVGRELCPKMRGRIVSLSWITILVFDFVLGFFGYGFSMLMAVSLAFLLIIAGLMLAPTHSGELEETLIELEKEAPTSSEMTERKAPKKVAKKSTKKTVKKKKQ